LLIFRPEIKNFGPVPGVNFVSEFRVFIDEVQEPTAKTPNPSSTLFPGQITGPTEKIGFSDYPGIVSGTKSLRFELAVQYDGPNGHYQECKTERFQHETGGFVDLGECGKN
jgi:hypothetical protein